MKSKFCARCREDVRQYEPVQGLSIGYYCSQLHRSVDEEDCDGCIWFEEVEE